MLTIVLVVIIALVVVGWLVLTFVVRGKRSSGADEARELLGGPDRIRVFDETAVCRGTESGEYNAWVGMGSLGLNDEELVFVRWSPHEVLRIPNADRTAHRFTVEHLGREYKSPLLQVTFRSPDHEDGETPGEDVVAWVVDDPDAWQEALAGSDA